MTEQTAPLSGISVGVTSARKGAELSAALRRDGAEVIHGPTIEPDQPAPHDEILASVEELLGNPPDWFAATTGVGVRLIAEVADAHDCGDDLRSVLAEARCVARGAKAVGGLRAVDVRPLFTSSEETDADLAAWLRERIQPGERLAVQKSGRTSAVYESLTSDTSRLQMLAPYRTGIPTDDTPARELIDAAVAGRLDVVVCTSAVAVDHLLAISDRHGQRDELVNALGTRVATAAIGAVTATAFERSGIDVSIIPKRHRTGELIRELRAWAGRRTEPDTISTSAPRG